jgi:hypothetical protein
VPSYKNKRATDYDIWQEKAANALLAKATKAWRFLPPLKLVGFRA